MKICANNLISIFVMVTMTCSGVDIVVINNGPDIIDDQRASVPNARYPLKTGITVAIDMVESRGKPHTVKAVKDELWRMAEANDVSLPYDYWHTADERIVAERETEDLIARMLVAKYKI